MMNNPFFEKSKQIADKFLQTVVLIDDQAYPKNNDKDVVVIDGQNHLKVDKQDVVTSNEEVYLKIDQRYDKQHELDAAAVTRNFAHYRKICSIYQPENESDIEFLTGVAKKADIVILDWQIKLNGSEDVQLNEEEDVQQEDPRGVFTLRIISGILSDPEPGLSGLKLILIYTGETNLEAIADVIHTQLKTLYNTVLNRFEVTSANFKVAVIGKPTLQVTHVPEINDRVVDYPDLPDFILSEFTKLTSGLISDFVLNALCILRSNTSRLLQLFNSTLDPALLAHCALLPNYGDAQEQLIEMLSHSFTALLNYNKAGENLSIERIESWIDSAPLNTHLAKLEIILEDETDRINVDKDFLKNWIRETFEVVCQTAWKSLKGSAPSNKIKGKILKIERNMHHSATKYFTEEADYQRKDCDFSILTHQKSNLKQPSLIPKLSLGSIVKKETGADVGYYVCIQQKCDSLRLENKPRKFLFLPLKAVSSNESFHFVINEGTNYTYLKTNFKIFNLYTAIFKPTGNHQLIKAKQDKMSSAYYFQSTSGRFVWLSDLKDAHAQRLSNSFASQLSRVGLDESEWLRRWAGN